MWSENQLKYSEKEFNPNQIYLFQCKYKFSKFPKNYQYSFLGAQKKFSSSFKWRVLNLKWENIALFNVFAFLLKMLRIIRNY